MENMTVADIVKATGGTLLCGDEHKKLCHISIDSRNMKGDDLFVPIIGEKSDAHRFIDTIWEKGAAATLTSEHTSMEDTHPWIAVADTVLALQAIGSYYRDRVHIPLVGITGSVGKTTTREMIATALTAKYRVYKTPGNSNSQVGVPITISEIDPDAQIGVLELGMSEPGELTKIASVARVDMAVITNIGITHIEQLGSQDNIYHEKLTIQDGMMPGGVLFLNGDDDYLKDTKAVHGNRTIYFGTGANADFRAEQITMEDGYPVFEAVHGDERVPVRLQVMGGHHVLNAMVALAVAAECGIQMRDAAAKLETFTGFKNRQQIYETDGVMIIDDTYNASPVSMKAALEVLRSIHQTGRKFAVLADMKELGEQTRVFHREIGYDLAEKPIDQLIVYGELGAEISAGAKEKGSAIPTMHFNVEEREQMITFLRENLKPGDCVLLKGSNSMKLGEVANEIRKYHY